MDKAETPKQDQYFWNDLSQTFVWKEGAGWVPYIEKETTP